MLRALKISVATSALGVSLLCIAAATPARAEGNPDLAQTARSVVRVSLIERDEKGDLYLHSHGSGFVAAPGMVVTNWHVVSASNGRSDLFVWITPHEGLGERAASGRITLYNSAADLAVIQAPSLQAPAALIAIEPPAHMGMVHAMGYPGLPCVLLHCTADEKIAPSTPDFSSGAISRFADRTPEGAPIRTIFHRAAISGGNSGGPLVDDCGRVVGVNTWVSGSAVTAQGQIDTPSPLSISPHPEAVIDLLKEAGAHIRLATESCVLEPVVPSGVQDQIDTLKRTVENAEEARRAAEARVLETASQARKATERMWRLMIMSAGLTALPLLIGLGMVAWRRPAHGPRPRRRGLAQQRGAKPLNRLLARQGRTAPLPARHIILAAGGAILVGGAFLFLIWAGSGWGPQAAVDADRPPAAPPRTEDSEMSTVYNLRCRLDADRSHGHPTQTDGLDFQFDTTRACVAGRTPYAEVPGGYERLLVSETEPRITINRLSDDLTTFTQSSYFVSDAAWRRHRTALDALGKPECPASADDIQALGIRLDAQARQVRPDLPRRPARESVWRCTFLAKQTHNQSS
ncbi:S1 family peptidase [Brevundimonas diminuta]|uniref:S1 family peptidase n=1 Tax=Brevundimonas diminuta TaxID=293 RepID=UPI003D0278BE